MSTHNTHKVGSQGWDDADIADFKAARDEPVTEVITEPATEVIDAYSLTQSAWDRRHVHWLRQAEQAEAFLLDSMNKPTMTDEERTARVRVITSAPHDAHYAERVLGISTDYDSVRAYLEQPLPPPAENEQGSLYAQLHREAFPPAEQPKELPAAKPRKRTPKAAQPPAKGDGDGLD